MFAAIVFGYAMPLIVKWCIDGILEGEFAGLGPFPWLSGFSDHAYLAGAAVSAVLCSAASGVLTYLRSRWAAIASQAITRRIRDRLFTHL